MWGRKRRSAAVAEPLDLRSEITRLTEANRRRPNRKTERELVQLRHRLGLELLDAAGNPAFAEPDDLAPSDALPEFTEVTPGILRAGILRDGCVLVRGLVPRDAALALADGIERAYADRETGGAFYDEFVPRSGPIAEEVRPWIKVGGGLLAADSPALTFQLFELLEAAGVPGLVSGYLGEPALWSFEKTTLRKADPAVTGAWHQDGHFMGPVRALNLWLSLSRCGDEAPGLDIVPRRLDRLVTAGDTGARLDYEVTDATAAAVAAPKRVERPIFEPGDALFFDELFLHSTASDPAMPNPRYAVESWFFGASGFPEYEPLAA